MSVYLVTWDLNKEKPNYAAARQDLLSRISQYDNIKDRGLDSVYFIATEIGLHALYTDLRGALDNNDRIMVVGLSISNYQGWLHEDAVAWINSRI